MPHHHHQHRHQDSKQNSTKNSQRSLAYQKAVLTLERELKFRDDETKAQIFDEFSNKCLMTKELWNKRLKLTENMYDRGLILKKAMVHFYYDKGYLASCHKMGSVVKFLEYPLGDDNSVISFQVEHMLMTKWQSKEVEKDLHFPHDKLQQIFMIYQKYSSYNIPKKIMERFEKMEKLYLKIKGSAGNHQKWINAMAKAGDVEFVRQNIEFKLGNDFENKKLWKLYVEYLRENDPKEMLQVYSKYCRFFLDDLEMKKEYKNATEKYGPVYVSWKNAFDFEIYSPNPIIFESLEEKPFSRNWPIFKLPKLNFNISKQDFPLPKPLMSYIRTNSTPNVYEKLQRTCKYFFDLNPTLFCYRFLFTDFQKDEAQFEGNSIECSAASITKFNQQKNLYITGSLNFSERMDKTCLSQIIQKNIYRCEAKFIEIWDQKITEKDFIFLVGHGKVESLELNDTEILKENGESMILEEILFMIPNLRSFTFLMPSVSIGNCLSSLKFVNKINNFYVSLIQTPIDSEDLCKFIKQNAAPYSKFEMNFHSNVEVAVVSGIWQATKTLNEKWKPNDEKPQITISKASLFD